jgi:hypothetical protein
MGCTYYIGGQEFTEKEFKKHLAGELDNYVKKGLVDLTKIKTIKNEKNKGSNVREIQKDGQGNAQNEGGQQNGKNVGQEANVKEEKVVQGEATPPITALKDVVVSKEQPKEKINDINQKQNEQDNIEQEPNIKVIEGKAESNDKAELNQANQEADKKLEQANVFVTPISELSTDPDRFQPRKKSTQQEIEAVAEELTQNYQGTEKETIKKKIIDIIKTTTGSLARIKAIVNDYQTNKLDALKTWKDKDGKVYVANHSRLSAHKILSILPKTDERVAKAESNGFIPNHIITSPVTEKTTEKEFKDLAQESNNNASQNTDLENANLVRGWKEEGLTKKEIKERADALFGANSVYFMALSNLNPNGKLVEALNSFIGSSDKSTQKKLEEIADWIGAARNNSKITNEHENELFDFLFDKELSKRITTKADFISKVSALTSDIYFDGSKPLNIARFKNKTEGESEYERQSNELKDQIAEKQTQIDALKSRFVDANNPQYVNPNSADYDKVKEIADNKIASINQEIKIVQKKLLELQQNKGKITGIQGTGSLFQKTKTKFSKISSNAFDKLVTRLNKAFPKTKVHVLSPKEMDDKLQEIGGNAGVNFQMVVNGENVTVQPLNAEVVNGFYSPLEKIINDVKQDKLPAKQWVEKFARGEEAKWTGLTDWLNQQQGSVSKADIQQYLKDNRIEIVEVVKGGERVINKGDYVVSFDAENNEWVIKDKYGNGLSRIDKSEAETKDAAIDIFVKEEQENNIHDEYLDDTKFSQYQLEGQKENYKEVLVTMPSKKVAGEAYHIVRDKYLIPALKEIGLERSENALRRMRIFSDENRMREFENDADYSKAKEALLKLQENGKQDIIDKYFDGFEYNKKVDELRKNEFKSSHFDEPNILVHLRMNTRTDAQGNKVLFLEEVQSDWGQVGKKEGFRDSKEAKKEKFLYDLGGDYKAVQKGWGMWASATREQKQAELYRIKKRLLDNGYTVEEFNESYDKWGDRTQRPMEGTPNAPFVTDTNSWTKLGLKVALKEAVKQGADKLAWSTGTQQFDRWGSEKISWKKEGDKWKLDVKEQQGGDAFGAMNIDEKALSETNVSVGSKERLRQVIKANLSRERNDAEIDKLTDRIWNRMQTEDIGTSLPRKEGMEEFYGNPKDMERAKDFTVKKEGDLFAVKDEKGKTIRTFKQENEANKFKENFGLGIVGNVAKSLFKQGVGTVNIDTNIDKNTDDIYVSQKQKDGYYLVIDPISDTDLGKFKTEAEAKDFLQKEKSKRGNSAQHSIDITPELKASVEGGQPLFMKNKNGEVYGFEHNGEIYIDRTKLNANTPIHEFGHVWLNFIKQSVQFKEHYEKGVALIKNTKEGKVYLDAVKANEAYKDLSESEQIDEALAMAIGDKGEMLHGNKYTKLKNWIKELWDGIKGKFHLIKNVDSFQGMTLEDFTKNAVGSLMKGEEIIDTKAQEQEQAVPEKAPLSEELQKIKDGFTNFIKNKTKGLGEAEVQKAIDNLFNKYAGNKDFIQELKDNNLSLNDYKKEVENELITQPNINEQQNATNNTEGQVQEVNQPSGSQEYQGTQNVSETQTTEANSGDSGGGSKEKEVTPVNEQIANIGNTAEQVSSDAISHRKEIGAQIVTGEDKMKTDIALNAKDAQNVLIDLKDTHGKNYLTKAIEAYMEFSSNIGASKKQLSSLASFGIAIENEIRKLQDGTIENTYNLNHRDLEMALRKIQPLNAELAQSVSASLNVQKTLYNIFDESESAKELMTTAEEEESKNIQGVLENKDGQLDAAAEEHEQTPQAEEKPETKPAKDTRKAKKVSAKDKAESKQKKSEILKELKEQIKKLNC